MSGAHNSIVTARAGKDIGELSDTLMMMMMMMMMMDVIIGAPLDLLNVELVNISFR